MNYHIPSSSKESNITFIVQKLSANCKEYRHIYKKSKDKQKCMYTTSLVMVIHCIMNNQQRVLMVMNLNIPNVCF